MLSFSLSPKLLSYADRIPKFYLLDLPFSSFDKVWKAKVGKICICTFTAWTMHSKQQPAKFAFMYSFSLVTVLT